MQQRAPRNRTLTCTQEEMGHYAAQLLCAGQLSRNTDIRGKLSLVTRLTLQTGCPRVSQIC